MKFRILSFSFCLLTAAVHAQNNYKTHTLQQGETLSALAQKYSTTVGDIMRMNGMHADTKLVYGSAIKIPSTAVATNTNDTHTKPAATTPTVEVKNTPPAVNNSATHVVEKGETLYSISKKYNISITQLQIINKLPGLNVSVGQQLVVNASAAGATASQPASTSSAPVTDSYTNKSNTTPTTVKAETVKNVQPDNAPAADDAEQVSNTSFTDNADEQPAFTPMGEGYFASQFVDKRVKDIQGTSMIFKTASGWSDGKYYILMNEADPGSIVKVTADNGKSIYAKVLWNMGDLKENQGINFRISNAAAMALNLNQDKFSIDVAYSKRNEKN